jgi:diacylglycerol kinase family enzyme
MHHARYHFACTAVARCIIAAGGDGTPSAEVYDEALNQWILLPCEVPGGNTYLADMGSSLL